jgi:hypothetical protein
MYLAFPKNENQCRQQRHNYICHTPHAVDPTWLFEFFQVQHLVSENKTKSSYARTMGIIAVTRFMEQINVKVRIVGELQTAVGR